MSEAGHTGDDAGQSVLSELCFDHGIDLDELSIEVENILRQPSHQGNRRHGDIGAFLRDQISETFRAQGSTASIKYIDPSYMIRSLPANARDANFCLRLGHAAVHAGMAGKTDVVIGSWRRRLTHVPIPLAVSSRKKVDIDGYLWQSVLSVTGQDNNQLSAVVGAS
jgi:6-phosphofructokinase 1